MIDHPDSVSAHTPPHMPANGDAQPGVSLGNADMTNRRPAVIRLHETDNVLVALDDLTAGTALCEWGVTLAEPVRKGHKIATAGLEPGTQVLKYGQIIGETSQFVGAGTHVHVHNCRMSEHRPDYAFAAAAAPLPKAEKRRRFMGYRRAFGAVGTRNYLGIVTSVNCAATVARLIAREAEKTDWLANASHIDGVVALVHGAGCGMADRGEGYETLRRTLSGYARHPNFAGVLMIGLGCEVMQIPQLVGPRMKADPASFQYMTIQQTGGTRATVARGLDILREMAQGTAPLEREPIDISELKIALQCGGSDGYSGITANPALGHAADLLVRHGGTAILAETPEIFGAEHLLTRRALSREIGEQLVERIGWWRHYTQIHGGTMDNNPSPGNKRGGLTTILEKSLGAIAKGGTAPLAGVFRYAEPVDRAGLVFMDSPGYDPCSVTGQVASGATLVIFTTGRGSVFGYKPAPSIKLATNSQTFHHMSEDMDINCGDIVDAGTPIETKGEEIFNMAIAVASGTPSKSEQLGFGDAEFVPWHIGAVM